MGAEVQRRAHDRIVRLAGDRLDLVALSSRLSAVIAEVIPFTRTCWHTVDPGTVLFTGSVNNQISCSGSWLAEHEYVIDDVDRWWFLARSSRHVGATSISTHGELNRSARHRSREGMGTGDELRVSLVQDGTYWGAAGFLREEGQPWFTEQDVRVLSTLATGIAEALRRSMLASTSDDVMVGRAAGPGVVIFDEHGEAESISPAAEAWISEMVEVPPPAQPAQSKVVQAVAARARTLQPGQDPLGLEARSRVRTRSGRWVLLYGTRLSGGGSGRTAVVLQPAPAGVVAPLVALAYGLSARERDVTQLCMQGRPTREMARLLGVSPYTVQDHLKSIFAKTGVRTRGELVGQIFLEHYVPRWEVDEGAPSGWLAVTDGTNRP
ncbi:MAG: LuxR C-terminal-related transcriptional regulator [Jatrophihabitans sp.]|uniref:LuxR C-terminal-related transcriptional regulator n=1 Tax=Jatrophihabitans sp. TaxID=1932789 RepID=UPI0039137E6B